MKCAKPTVPATKGIKKGSTATKGTKVTKGAMPGCKGGKC